MSKLEDIINSYRVVTPHWADQEWSEGDIWLIAKEYAEYYAKKCLQIAAEEAQTKCIPHREFGGADFCDSYEVVDKDTILNIKLPEHE